MVTKITIWLKLGKEQVNISRIQAFEQTFAVFLGRTTSTWGFKSFYQMCIRVSHTVLIAVVGEEPLSY